MQSHVCNGERRYGGTDGIRSRTELHSLFVLSKLLTCSNQGVFGLRCRQETDRQTGESPLNTWKRPESVCGEFAGCTTGFYVLVGFLSLMPLPWPFGQAGFTSFASDTFGVAGSCTQDSPSPHPFFGTESVRGVRPRGVPDFLRVPDAGTPRPNPVVGPCLNRPTPRAGGGPAGFALNLRPADFWRPCH